MFGDESLGVPAKLGGATVPPRRYADFQTAGLQVTIEGPTDGLVIELGSNGASTVAPDMPAFGGTGAGHASRFQPKFSFPTQT